MLSWCHILSTFIYQSLYQINFHHDAVPHCMEFDVDLQTNTVKCVRGGYATNDDEINAKLRNRATSKANTVGPSDKRKAFFESYNIKILLNNLVAQPIFFICSEFLLLVVFS